MWFCAEMHDADSLGSEALGLRDGDLYEQIVEAYDTGCEPNRLEPDVERVIAAVETGKCAPQDVGALLHEISTRGKRGGGGKRNDKAQGRRPSRVSPPPPH